MKRKVSLITLIMCIFITSLCLVACNPNSPPDDGVTISKELVSVNQSGEASNDRIELEMPRGTDTKSLPTLLIRNTNDVTKEVFYSLVNTKNLSFSTSDKLTFDGLACSVLNDEIEFDISLEIKVADGTDGELTLPLRVFRNYVAVESISLSFEDNSTDIGLTEKKVLSAEILPVNADYKSFIYSIEKIEKPDKTLYSGDFTQYAKIENGSLETTDKISIGSKIHISATTTKDNVKSEIFVVEVKRIEITNISLINTNQYLKHGESLTLNLSAYPKNATFNILLDEEISVSITGNQDCGTIEKVSDFQYKLTAVDNTANIGKDMTVSVSIGGFTKTFKFGIVGTSVESILLFNEQTQAELEDGITLNRDSTLKVYAVIFPENASVINVNYYIYADIPNFGRYVDISNDGLITVTDLAPFGMEIYVSASAMGASTQSYKITVVEIPVESVTLSAESDSITKNSILTLNATITPSIADYNTVIYRITNDVTGVYISGNRLFASEDAVINSEIEVVAIVNGIESNKLTIRVVEAQQVIEQKN